MKDLKETFIMQLAYETDICPNNLELKGCCDSNCRECWIEALKNVTITQTEESK